MSYVNLNLVRPNVSIISRKRPIKSGFYAIKREFLSFLDYSKRNVIFSKIENKATK